MGVAARQVVGAVTAYRDVVRSRSYFPLWLGQLCSNFGDVLHYIALVVLVFRLTGHGLAVAGLVAAEIVPVLLLGPVAGVIIDRFSRKGVLIAADLCRAALALSLVWPQGAWHAYAVAAGLSAGGTFFNPTMQAVIPALTTEEQRLAANSVSWSTAQLVQIVGAAIVGGIAYEAVRRLQRPEPVTPWVMFVSAAVGIAVNLYIGLGLQKEGGENLNVRAALLHVFGDVGASAAVILGGLVILLTGWSPADPLISLAIAALIAWGAWRILRETIDILMEAAPRDLNMAQIVRDVVRVPGIRDIHDLHVWSIAGGMRALSAHVQVVDRPLSTCDALLGELNQLLQERYRIGHTTIQFECAGCTPNNLYCTLGEAEPAGRHRHEHEHAHAHAHAGENLEARADAR
jgi:cobalt-zinc-cadmium efflux system protein